MGDGYSDDSEEDLKFDPPPMPVVDAAVVVPVAPNGDVVEHSFSVEAPGAVRDDATTRPFSHSTHPTKLYIIMYIT